MSSLRLSNLTPSKWLCLAIVLFCMFGAPELVSGTGAMTDLGARIICIYVGMAFGWLTLDLAWPSVLGILAVGLSGYSSVNNVLKMCFGNSSALLVFFVFIITGVIDKAGVSRWIALHICSLPIGRGRPWVMTFCILAAIMTLTLFIGVSPGVLVVWAIFYSICEVYGIKPGEHWATMVMVAIQVASRCGPRRVFPAQRRRRHRLPPVFCLVPHRGLHDRRAYAGLHALRAQAGREQDL